MIKQAAFAVVCAILFLYGQGQTVTVTAVPGPDETMSQKYVALDGECRRLVSERQHPAEAVTACKQVAEQADQFAPQSHFITRRGAFVYYTSALIQAKDYKAAVTIADKAVAVVLLGHDDASGSSAAYGVRGQARAFAGDLAGADKDLERAEAYQRNGLNSPAGQELKAEYSRTLKGLLMFHAQVLDALGNNGAAMKKRDEANAL